MKKIQEDHKEIASGKKKDDEGYMAGIELDSIERAVKNLRKAIKTSDTQLPAWVQSKITRAADYIDTAAEYLQSDEKLNEASFEIDKNTHKKETKKTKVTGIIDKPGTPGEGAAAQNIVRKMGGTGVKAVPQYKHLPPRNEEISLVEKILGEEKCGKGMYWCNTDKVCKPLPEGFNVSGQKKKPTEVGIGKPVAEQANCNHSKKGKLCSIHGMDDCSIKEEKDPKGPVQAYKSPQEIAKKHGVSLDQINAQLKMGIKVEGEHTSDKTAARITALQHLDEVPDYYTKLKKVETQKESKIVRDMFGNASYEFIDLITADPLIKEAKKSKKNNPCWSGYKKDPNKADFEKGSCIKVAEQSNVDQQLTRAKIKKERSDVEYANTVARLSKQGANPETVNETTIPTQYGHNFSVTLMWRAKYYNIQMFFPQIRMPTRREISDEANKVYPNCKVITYTPSRIQSNVPVIQVPDKKSKNYLMNNGNIGEEVEIIESKKSEMACNKPKSEPYGSGETGKSHVVKACEDGKEKLIRFGQLGVKGSPKKEGESKEYADRRSRFKKRHKKNIKKGKMSAAYWANKVKW